MLSKCCYHVGKDDVVLSWIQQKLNNTTALSTTGWILCFIITCRNSSLVLVMSYCIRSTQIHLRFSFVEAKSLSALSVIVPMAVCVCAYAYVFDYVSVHRVTSASLGVIILGLSSVPNHSQYLKVGIEWRLSRNHIQINFTSIST